MIRTLAIVPADGKGSSHRMDVIKANLFSQQHCGTQSASRLTAVENNRVSAQPCVRGRGYLVCWGTLLRARVPALHHQQRQLRRPPDGNRAPVSVRHLSRERARSVSAVLC